MRRVRRLQVAVLLCLIACAQSARAERTLGVGFLWLRGAEEVLPKLTHDCDFVDQILGRGRIPLFEQIRPPVRFGCICLSLAAVEETVGLLRESDIGPERVYITYNPERRGREPNPELEDFLGSIRRARELVKGYDAPLLVGPGLSFMNEHEDLYPGAAALSDVWMLQSQRLHLTADTREPVPVEQYRQGVQRIVGLLRKGNPDIKVFVQIIAGAPEGRLVLTDEQVAEYAAAIGDLVDAVRLYGVWPERVAQIIGLLERAPAAQPALPARAAPPPRERTVMIDMRDGARLATDLYMPDGYSPDEHPDGVPVVLIRTPYNKEKPVDIWSSCVLGNGYALAIQDMRGYYGSAEAGRGPSSQDGYDTIEWLAAQPWCNGKVGMIGFSHLGAAQYEAAVTAPPHLACTIPAQAPGNYYTDSYYQTVFRKADAETLWRGAVTSRTAMLLRTRIRRQQTSRIEQFRTPMLHSAGWYDFYKEGAVEMFRACQRDGGPGARGNQKLLIGPWGHGVLQEQDPGQPLKLPGGLAYPPNAKLDWEGEVWLPWYDYWLKGEPTGVMDEPAVRYYLMGDVDDPDAPGNEWVEADDFPPPSVPVPYYIHPDRTLGTAPPAARDEAISYKYDPADPVPTVGRSNIRIPVKGPYDQREVEGRPDVLVFTTPVLDAPLEIVGQVRAKLWASSDRKDTDFTAKLTDVYPDGRSMIFLDGIVKARYRNTYLEEELLEPARAYEFDVDLGYIAIVLAPGHRLRLAISSSNFDRFDINPNTGEPYGDHATTRALLAERFGAPPPPGEPEYSRTLVATNTIYMDGDHPSHVVLPVMPTDDARSTGGRPRVR